MSDFREKIDGYFASVGRKKEELVKNIFAKAGYSHYLENLENKRFQRVHMDLEDTGIGSHDEHYYIDNGTDEGHLLCTISTNTIFDGNNCRIEITTKEFPYVL